MKKILIRWAGIHHLGCILLCIFTICYTILLHQFLLFSSSFLFLNTSFSFSFLSTQIISSQPLSSHLIFAAPSSIASNPFLSHIYTPLSTQLIYPFRLLTTNPQQAASTMAIQKASVSEVFTNISPLTRICAETHCTN